MKKTLYNQPSVPTSNTSILTTSFLKNLHKFIPTQLFYLVLLALVVKINFLGLFGLILCKLLYQSLYSSMLDTISMLPRDPYNIDIPVVGLIVLCSKHPSILYIDSKLNLITDQYYYYGVYGVLNKQNHNMVLASFAPTQQDLDLNFDVNIDQYGVQFKSNQLLIPLLPYKLGDKMVSGRFGHTIRFTHLYDSNLLRLLPQIKISNNNYNCKRLTGSIILNLFDSGGSLYFLSRDSLEQPNTIPIPSTRTSLDNYLTFSLLGNSILLVSDRILLSAKVNSLEFFSNKNILLSTNLYLIELCSDYIRVSDNSNILCSDYHLNASSILLDGQSKILLSTNTCDIAASKISLGEGASQPLVLGTLLVSLLTLLCTAISSISIVGNLGIPTPPPINAAQFASISSRLSKILSKTNTTT